MLNFDKSDGSRLFPIEDEKAKIMEQLRFVFSVTDEFDEDILDGILEDLPQYVNSEAQFQNLTGTHLNTLFSNDIVSSTRSYLANKHRHIL